MIDTPGNLESLHNARRCSHWDFRFREECIVVSRSSESASGVDEFQTCQFCQEPRPRWSSMCAYTRLVWPPRLNQLLTDTKDRRRISHRIKGPRNASAGSIPRDDRALTEERLRIETFDLPLFFFLLVSCYLVLILLPSVPLIGNRFYLVCWCNKKISTLRNKNTFVLSQNIFVKND